MALTFHITKDGDTMANYYIADLHLGHVNIIQFDNRPFADLTEMHDTILNNWNSRVTGNDTVYVIGDFIWAKESEWPFYLGPLAGNKVLITGNHDPKQFSREVRKFFQDVKNYKEITDDGRHVIMSHYAMPFHKAAYNENCWMLYGHVHRTREYDFLKKLRAEIKASCTEQGHAKGNFINVGCMLPYMDYTPRTLDEIIEGDRLYSET